MRREDFKTVYGTGYADDVKSQIRELEMVLE